MHTSLPYIINMVFYIIYIHNWYKTVHVHGTITLIDNFV